MTSAPIVFFDIAGPDARGQEAFYRGAFGWAVGPGGTLEVAAQNPLRGLLRTDPAGTMLYFGVPDVTAALAGVVEHGGQVTAPRFEVPGRVVLGLFVDPAGNRLGLVEMDGDRAKVP
jgi:predicted enzyme related to lactoylglutathione lyase